MDLIPTIYSDDEISNHEEEESENEDDQFQPHNRKKNKSGDFDPDFVFDVNPPKYDNENWDDIEKYIKRKVRSKVDDKINKARKERASEQKNNEEEESNEENEDNEVQEEGFIRLSDDELKYDKFKTKEKKVKKKKKHAEEPKEEKMEFEEFDDQDVAVSFHQMNLSRPLLKAISAMNYLHPTPIQAATIPVALMGRDICGCAATGTGKTAAYMLPTLERLLYRPVQGAAITRVLVLVPTRELGVQVYQVIKQLTQFTTIETGLSVGGLDVKIQEAVLRKNPDIVIATPGRLIDHVNNAPSFSLDTIEILILDEADRMLDEFFAEQMKYIIKNCSLTRQTMLFSATMTEEVKDLAAVSLNKPVKVFVDSNKDVALNLRQEFIRIRKEREGDREAILAALICRTFKEHTIVFLSTKRSAHRLHILLGLLGVKVGELHGNLTQPQRLENLRKFKDEEIDVLLATDVAARGLDISGVKTVINFMMPSTMEHYIHRVGRTARAGRGGVSVSLAGEQDRHLVKDIIKGSKNPVKNRLIPSDIIEKYNAKLASFEPDVEKILGEEKAEREIAKLENKTNRVQNMLNEKEQDNRTWFQTTRERKTEKENLKQVKKEMKPKKKSSDNEDKELSKVAAFQARAAKKKNRQKKIRICDDNVQTPQSAVKSDSRKRARSSFVNDLTNTSKKNVKRMRYETNTANKQKGKNKFGKNQKNSKTKQAKAKRK